MRRPPMRSRRSSSWSVAHKPGTPRRDADLSQGVRLDRSLIRACPRGLIAEEVPMEQLNYEEFVRELEADPRTLVRVDPPRPPTALLPFADPPPLTPLSCP